MSKKIEKLSCTFCAYMHLVEETVKDCECPCHEPKREEITEEIRQLVVEDVPHYAQGRILKALN